METGKSEGTIKNCEFLFSKNESKTHAEVPSSYCCILNKNLFILP